MSNNNLLPCPFCGNKAYEASYYDEAWADDEVEETRYFVVGCRNCRFKFESDFQFTREDIISKWNTRAKESPTPSSEIKYGDDGLPIVTENSPEYLQIWDRDQI